MYLNYARMHTVWSTESGDVEHGVEV